MSNPDNFMLRVSEWWERVGRHFTGDRFGLAHLAWQASQDPTPDAIAIAMTDRDLLRDHELRGLIRPYPTRPARTAQTTESSSVTWEPITYMLYTPHKDNLDTLHMCEAEDAGAFLVYRSKSEKDPAHTEALARYCPGCGGVGPVEEKYLNCCPDGDEARMIPRALAEKCHDTFKIAVKSMMADAAANDASKAVPILYQHDDGRYGLSLTGQSPSFTYNEPAWHRVPLDVVEGDTGGTKPKPTDDELWDQTLRERDRYHNVADRLANAIAEHFGVDIGEHSSANCPWTNALDAFPADSTIALAQQQEGGYSLTQAARDVLAERRRQIEIEGWTAEHDDEHADGELASAAAAYAINAADQLHPLSQADGGRKQPHSWPWAPEWWKPSTPRRDLEKAAALILAELEHIDRAERAVAQEGPK